jgi:hypothetical protein
MSPGSVGFGGSGGTGGSATTDARSDVSRDSSADADSRSDGLGFDGRGGAGGVFDGRTSETGEATGIGGGAGTGGNDGSSGAGGATGGDAEREVSTDSISPVDTSTPDNGHADAGESGDAPLSDARDGGTLGEGDAATVDTSDGSSLVDASDGADQQVAPDGANAVCGTPIPPTATVLFGFDGASEATGWEFNTGTMLGGGGYPPPVGTPNPAWNNANGCPGPGQLQFVIPFDSYAGSADADGSTHPQGVHFTYDLSNPARDWTNNSVVHLKIMVETPGGLEFVQPYLDLSNPPPGVMSPVMNPYGSNEYTAAILGVGIWRDLRINLPGPEAGTIAPARLGFELYATQPGQVVFDIDTIWLE